MHGWDFFYDDNSTFDGTVDDHGTHVSGTIGARDGNGTGVAGVNWKVSLFSAKFLGPVSGSSDMMRIECRHTSLEITSDTTHNSYPSIVAS